MDSIRIYYSNDEPGGDFNYIGQAGYPDTSYTFPAPFGVTDRARVKLVAVDIYGNEGENFSNYFTVTDNTPPEVSVITPSNAYISDTL